MVEVLRTFTKDFRYLRDKEREEVHKDGDWHEVFHCWVLEKRLGEWWIYLQQRSLKKKDYPGDLDITAAGHIEASERVEDGVRELHEELGILVAFDELMSLCVIPYHIQTNQINDAEFAHVFLYVHKGELDDLIIQREELDGLYVTRLSDFLDLIDGSVHQVSIEGYQYKESVRVDETRFMTLEDLGALPKEYLYPLKARIENVSLERV